MLFCVRVCVCVCACVEGREMERRVEYRWETRGEVGGGWGKGSSSEENLWVTPDRFPASPLHRRQSEFTSSSPGHDTLAALFLCFPDTLRAHVPLAQPPALLVFFFLLPDPTTESEHLQTARSAARRREDARRTHRATSAIQHPVSPHPSTIAARGRRRRQRNKGKLGKRGTAGSWGDETGRRRALTTMSPPADRVCCARAGLTEVGRAA